MNDRQCQSCVWFIPGARNFTGRCSHPDRQLPVGPQPWVRNNELACRYGWERDRWERGRPIAEDQVLDITMLDPDDPRAGAGDDLPLNLLQRLIILPDLPLVPEFQDVLIDEVIVGRLGLSHDE